MNHRSSFEIARWSWLPVLLLALPGIGHAQVPVDENGEPLGEFQKAQPAPAAGADDIPLLSSAELQELVGPIALYPDDLLAVVLPATSYPLQIVQVERFLRDLEDNASLQPDESWDDSVVALTNYPEVVELLTDDLDRTWRLGEAVVAQQADVIAAIETFRDRAYAAGNLKSDEHQTVTQDEGIIEINPVEDDVIYVPYYEPERVVVYQRRPVYHYYPRAFPVYNYPYPAGYAFNRGYFWGVTTAFSLGWHTDRLHVFHHSYHGHPYYGRSYWNNWWYRSPSISVYNNYYYNNYRHYWNDRYRRGDYWRPQPRRTIRGSDQRVTRTRYYPNSNPARGGTTVRQSNRNANAPAFVSRGSRRDQPRRDRSSRNSHTDIQFRQRPQTGQTSANRIRTPGNTVKSKRITPSSGIRPNGQREPVRLQPNNVRQSQTRREVRASTTRPAPSRTRETSRNLPRREIRQSNQLRQNQTQPRQSQQRQSQPRQSQQQQSQPRQSQQRQRQAEPRQSQSRNDESGQKRVASKRGRRGESDRSMRRR